MKAKKIIGLLLALVMCLGIMTPIVAFASNFEEVAKGNVVYYEDFSSLADADHTGKEDPIGEAHGIFGGTDKDTTGGWPVRVAGALDGSGNQALNYMTTQVSGNATIDLRLNSAKHGLVKDLSQDFVLSFKLYPQSIKNMTFAWADMNANEKRSDKNFGISGGYITMGGIKSAVQVPTNQWSTIEIIHHYDEAAGGVNAISVRFNGEYVTVVKDGATVDTVATVKTDGTAQVDPNINHWRIQITKNMFCSFDDITIAYLNAAAPDTPVTEAKTEFVGYQTTAATNDKFNLRLVGIMNDADISQYAKVGFKVKATYGTTEMNKTQDITTVYESITATSGSNYTEYTAEALGGSYIFALNCLNVPANAGAITFEVTTYYQLEGSEVVEEATVTFTVDPATDIPKADAK